MGMLSGMRIIEGSAFVAAPLAGLTLAQMGAEVIRFDLPGGGLDYKRMPRHPETGKSFFWAGLNKGKKSITIDFRKGEGAELIQELITAPGEGGGILLTNFAGLPWLEYQGLSKRRSDVISLEIMGNFDGGSEVDYTVNTAVGIPAITGSAGMEAPVNNVLPAWDLACGMQASTALLAAHIERLRTGKGKQMSLALSDTALAVISNLGMLGEAENGSVRAANGNELFGGFGRDFVTADNKRVMVVCLTLKQWREFQKATGLGGDFEQLASQVGEGLNDEEIRYRHRHAIAQIVEPWFSASPLSAVEEAFGNTGVCWSRYQTFDELLKTDYRASSANPLWHQVSHPGLGQLRTPSSPVMVEGRPQQLPEPAPVLGEHTEMVLSNVLGLTTNAISQLADRKIIDLQTSKDQA